MTQREKPDILLIVLDTLRADRLSCYGYPRPTSPHIDALAADSVLFEQAISPGQWTIPAHASMFTGEYPTTHMTTQIYDRHSEEQPTLAEVLQRAGYHTVGFCNNPLLGVVENGLDRGFDAFYNYGGTLPERPDIIDSRPRRAGKLLQRLSRVLRRGMASAQDIFARSDLLLRIALHPLIIPLWQRHINFKGNTVQSMRDVVGYMRTRERREDERPLFTFVNLMETHLPFGPPPRFTHRFASYYRRDQEARDFMQEYNLEHYRWMIPLREPLGELEDRVINDLYDAEVAYTDHMLHRLFDYLNRPEVRENTMVIITSDHGEGLNNHHFVGHSLVAYDDLVHVPLIVRYPRLYPAGRRVSHPVSTRRIFHAALEAAGIETVHHGNEDTQSVPVNVADLSLTNALNGANPEEEILTEAYIPHTLLTLMKNNDPEAIDIFRCHDMRRAVYQDRHKLITVGDQPDEMFDVIADPGELENLLEREPERAQALNERLQQLVAEAESRRPANWEAHQLHLEEDEKLMERLRGLGYVE
jgi:uncharacterized sulfatase